MNRSKRKLREAVEEKKVMRKRLSERKPYIKWIRSLTENGILIIVCHKKQKKSIHFCRTLNFLLCI